LPRLATGLAMERFQRAVGSLLKVVAISMSLYHLWAATFGSPEAMMHRSIHLTFTFGLIFLVSISGRKSNQSISLITDILLLAGSILAMGHIFLNYDYVVTRYPYVQSLSGWDFWLGILVTLLLLEASRRAIGPALPLTAVAFLLYGLFGQHLPGILRHTGFSLETLVDQLYLTTEGIFGIPLGVSATYVILFVIYGSFLEESGAGEAFTKFAVSLVGGTRGGPGKISCVSSSLFGTISGSAVANVMVDGWLTIPLMKRAGFRPDFAAAVEATASTGGQIMPPVMGAAAFVIAEFTGISYIDICKHALVPALLYYLALFMAIHFEASRSGLMGIPREERPSLKAVILEKGHLFVPILVIVYFMIGGYTPMLACLYAIASVLPMSFLRKESRMDLKKILRALEGGARNMLAVAAACACAGIVVGIINLTGLGLKFTGLMLDVAGGSLAPALLLTMLTGIILGMGLPTTAAYIVQAALLIPGLIKLGVPVIAAHLFVFYFAIISAITPPVAMAVYAAAGIGGSNVWKTGIQAVRIGATGFVVPFMFVYGPSLLLIGSWWEVATTILSASLGVILLSAGLMGWFMGETRRWQQVVLVAAAILLIKPGVATDLVGAGLAVALGLWQRLAAVSKKRASLPAMPEKNP
jgi:TRAP transporter 4TM/12TM fusion protein